MPNWNRVLAEISQLQAASNESAFDIVRRRYLKQLKEHTGRNVIAYYSGFLSKPRTEGVEITDEDKNGFMLCIHELDRNEGLDLILHTPGGDGKATESLVDYLRSMFGHNIRAIVPQIAMSAGTMIACSCRSILMGKHSSLGPIDPQFGAVSAVGLLEEVKKAYKDITDNPNTALFWNPILGQITPSFLHTCESAINDAKEFIDKTLAENMLSDEPQPKRTETISKITALFSNEKGVAHNTHFPLKKCAEVGLRVDELENDQTLQDLVLTVHHCYMHTLTNTAAFKIVENHLGRAMVRLQQIAFMQSPVSLAPGGPS